MDKNVSNSPLELLKAALKNPNPVSTLLIGASGVGKTHALEKLSEELGMKRKSIPAVFTPTSLEGWMQLLGDLHNEHYNLLIIDHVEDMPMLAQAAMFHIFSNAHGELWTFPDRNYKLKIVFTSLKSTDELRNNADIIMPHFYDRISQLIIRFRSLQEVDDIWTHFKQVWKGLHFDTHSDLPKESSLRSWISNNTQHMNGNYRDLEKLAIRWHNRRLLGYFDHEILPNINREYQEGGFGAEPEDEGTLFPVPIPDGKKTTWLDIDAEFRRFVRAWAIKEYGSVKAAAAMLGISTRTLERWH